MAKALTINYNGKTYKAEFDRATAKAYAMTGNKPDRCIRIIRLWRWLRSFTALSRSTSPPSSEKKVNGDIRRACGQRSSPSSFSAKSFINQLR